MSRKLVLMACAITLIAGSWAFMATADAKPPAKVRICHFPGHRASSSWTLNDGTTLTGDYVTLEGTPPDRAIEYCATHGGGGQIIWVSAKGAIHGHGVQLQDRIGGYR